MQKITLNLIPDGVPPVVYVNQFDTGREFQILFKEGLSPYNFPSGVAFRINGRKADNHVFEYTESDKWDATHYIITKSGSGTSLTVTIATSEQMTAAAGEAEVQLTFKSSSASNDILGTLNFILVVQEKPDANGDPSESDIPGLVRSVNGIDPDASGNVLLPPAQGAIGAHNIAPVEPTRIMSTVYSAGDYVYVTADDQLYKVTSPIGAGGTLIPRTNAIDALISSDLTSKLNWIPFGNHNIGNYQPLSNYPSSWSELLFVFKYGTFLIEVHLPKNLADAYSGTEPEAMYNGLFYTSSITAGAVVTYNDTKFSPYGFFFNGASVASSATCSVYYR